jgi:hypothetical protein
MRVGLVAEGRGDLAVLVNILKGKLGLDLRRVQFLRPEYWIDETDTYEQDEAERGGWVRVKNECVEQSRIAEFLDNAKDDDAFVVVQVDTAEAHEKGFDVVRPDRQHAAYAEQLRQRVVEKIDAWLAGSFPGRVRHAVAVEETDAWVLTIHSSKDTAGHHDPKKKLTDALNKTMPERERKRLFQRKAYPYYDELSKPFRKARDLEKFAERNRSLRLFVDSLPQRPDDSAGEEPGGV